MPITAYKIFFLIVKNTFLIIFFQSYSDLLPIEEYRNNWRLKDNICPFKFIKSENVWIHVVGLGK